MRLFLLLCCSLACVSGFAGSVRLINDSPHKLRVVIRGQDGSNRGEMIIEPDNATTWYDPVARTGQLQKGNIYQNQPWRAQTPYAVLWYCMDGNDYSFCQSVNPGDTVTAQGCDGARQCKLIKKKPGEQHPSERDTFFENEVKKEQRAVGPPKY
jgi:hypothetical protein